MKIRIEYSVFLCICIKKILRIYAQILGFLILSLTLENMQDQIIRVIRACPFELHFSSLGHSSFEASLANTSAGGLSLSKKGLEGLKQCLFSINFHVKNGRKFQRTQNIHTYVGARRKPIQNNTIFKTVVLKNRRKIHNT